MATEADVKDPISAPLNEVEHKEIISDFSNTIINKIVTEEREKVESGTIQPSETVTIFPRTEESQETNKENVEIHDEGHTGSTVGELFLQPPPVVTGLLKKDTEEIQRSLKQGAHSLQEENEGISNDVIVSVEDGKIETWQEENSGEGEILVQGNEPTEEILESSKTGAAEQIHAIIESPYAEINTITEKEESVDHVLEVVDEASRINIKITDEQNSLSTANVDEKASTELTYSPNEEALQLEGIDHDKVPSKEQAYETFEVHQEEKHVQGNNEADKGPEGTEKIEITTSTKAPVYEFNEDPEQQEKAPKTETETATVGIEKYQTSIEVETNAIKELDPSIVLEEEEEERSFKIPITTEKEVREPNIECTGQASDKEFTGVETPNYEILSEGLNKQSHLVAPEGKITSQEKNMDDGKASSDPEVSKDEIEQPTAAKDDKALDILEEDEELSNTAPERDKTGNNMLVKDDQLQFGGSITISDKEEAVFEKNVLASSSSKEDIEIEKRVELDVEAKDHVNEEESDSSNTVTEKVISYNEGLSIPLEQNIESLDKSKELKLVAGSLSNDDEINTTEQNNLEKSYNNQTGSREEQTTVQDNKGDENDTKEDIKSISVGQEEIGKTEEKTLTEEVPERLSEIDENELHKDKSQKLENTEDFHVMPEVNETLKQTTVPYSTTLHDHGAIYFDSGFSEDKITEDLAQHAEELSMSTEIEKESVEAVEKPEDFTTRTSDESQEKIKDEKEEQEINDDAPTMIIEETFLAEAQFDHYSVKEADEISCEKHESETTIEFGNIKLAENERASGFDDQVPERSLEALPGQSAQEIDEVEKIEKILDPKCQDFERGPNVETPLTHETRPLQIDEDPKEGDDQSANKLVDTNDKLEDLEVMPSTESPLVLEESKNTIFEQLVKDRAALKESEIALEFDDQVHGRSFEASQFQSVQGVVEIEEFEKIEEPQSQDFERVADVETLDVKTPLAHETGLLHVDPNDGDDDTPIKTVKDYVTDLEVAPAIEYPLVLEEIKKATLEKPVKDEVHLEESEITPGSDDQVQEKSLESFPGLLHVDPNDRDDDTPNKTVKDYVTDLEVAPAIESPLVLEEIKKATLEKPVKDEVHLEESEITTGSDDQVQEKSLEFFPGQTTPGAVDEVNEIEKISEPECQDFERVADVETLDIQTAPAHETGILKVDENFKNGANDTADKVTNIEDYAADLEVVQAIEPPLALEESKTDEKENPDKSIKDNVEKEENETDDQVLERSLEDLPCKSAEVVGVDEVEEIEKIEKISEPQSQAFERIDDFQTSIAHKSELIHVDPKDGDDDTANKVVNTEDYVADFGVVPAIESPLVLEESKNTTLQKLYKDQAELKEGEIALESDDQGQERSLEALTRQSAQGVDEVEEIEKLSDPQFQDLEIVADVETIDVKTPLSHDIGLLHVDPNDGDDDTANKTVKDYVVDLEVAPSIESPLLLEESKKETLEQSEKDKVHLEEGEITTGSNDQVQQKSLEAFPGQTTPGIDEVEKISEPQCQDFIGVDDVQTPPAQETGLLKVDENSMNGANDTTDKDINIEDYVADQVVHAIESPLVLEERKEIEKNHPEKSVKDNVEQEKNETEDYVLECSQEDLSCKSAKDVGVEEIKENEKISKPQSQDFDRIDDVQTPIAHESELLHVDPKDGHDDTMNKFVNTEDSLADIEVVSVIESPLGLEESKNATLQKHYEHQAELKESETALESSDQVHERSLEALTHQSAQGVDEVEEIEKISETQFQDLEIVETHDVKTPLAHETRLLHVDPNDGDDDTNSKIVKDHVVDLKVAPATESPLVLEESKKETLEKPVKDQVHLEESEITTGSDDQVSEKSLEAFPGQTTPGVDEVEKIFEPQFQDIEIVADVESIDVQTPPVHETGLLHVDSNDGDDDTAHVADLEVAPSTESPLVLEESKKETLEKPVKDEVHLQESVITTGSDDPVPEKSHDIFPSQTTPGVDEVKEIEKISEPQCQDFERVADVETLDVHTSPAHETGLLKIDENLNGAIDTADKGTNIKDYVAGLEVVHAIVSPLALEESKEIEKENPKNSVKINVEKEKNETKDQVLERSLEDLPCKSAQDAGVDEVKEIEKISEPQSQDFERFDDVQTPIAYESEVVPVDPKDGDDDTANKVGNTEDYVAGLVVVPAIESLALEESKNTTIDKLYKDQAELKEGDLALQSDDQVQERSLEALTHQSAHGVDEVGEIENISDPQCQDLEIVAAVEKLDVKTPHAHDTGLLHVDPNDGDDDTDSKLVKDYVADLKVAPTTESPLVLEESKKETIEKSVKDEVHREESEILTGSDDQVPEKSLDAFPGQTTPGVDEVEEIEKISEPQCQDFERVSDVQTLDVQTPPAHETELLKVDEKLKGANDTTNKGTNLEDYVEDVEGVYAIESTLALKERNEIEKENPEMSVNDNIEEEKNEMDDRVLERSLEDLSCKIAQDVDELKEIEKISEPQSQDFERIDDVQIPIAYESELVHVDPKDGGDDTANKVGNTEDYVTDLVVVPAIESPLALEESKNTTLEKLYKDQAELTLESDDQVQERSLEALTRQSAQGVDEVKEIKKISEPQFEDLEIVAAVETLDFKTPLPHERELLHVDPKEEEDDTANKAVKDYVADLKVAPAIESPLLLEESKKETLEQPVKDKIHLEEGEITTGSDDQVQKKSLEAFPGRTTPGIDEVEEIGKISEPQCQDFIRVADVQTTPANETGLLKDENCLNGANDTTDKDTNIEDYVADQEVVHAIESPLVLEESKEVEKDHPEKSVKDNLEQEKNETDDRVLESSQEDLSCKSAQDVGVEEVKENEKISEPQSQDFDRIDDVQTPIAHESELLHLDSKDVDDDIANKVGNTEDYVVDIEVVTTVESPLEPEESRNTTLEKLYKDRDELKEGEIALESYDRVQEVSLEALTRQSEQGVDEVEEIEKLSEPQFEHLEIVASVETLDVEAPLAHETGLLHVDPKEGDDDTANKNVKDYVADLEVAPDIESPYLLEESKKATLEQPVKDKINLEESETGSDDQVQEKLLEAFPCQTTPRVDEVGGIEKISEPQCQDFERVADVETLDVQTSPAHETGLLKVDENLNGANDTADKGTNIEDYVADLEVVHAIESPLALEESKEIEKESPEKSVKDNVEKEKNEMEDQVLERSLEDLPCKSAQDAGVDEVKEIEKISEPQSQDFERIDDVQTLIAYESELVPVDPKDGGDDTTNKVGNALDYVEDLVVVPAIESPLALEESKNTTIENKGQAELKEGDLALQSNDEVQERSLESLTYQSAQEVDEVEEIENISEPQCQDLEIVAAVETLDVKTPLVHETGLLQVDTNPKEVDDQSSNKGADINDYVADLEVVSAIESALALEDSKNTTLEKLLEDKDELKESEIAHGINDEAHERSFEALPCKSVQGVDEVEEFEKISEPQRQDFERVVDAQTPTHVDPNDGGDDDGNRSVNNTGDHITDLEVVPTIDSPLELEEDHKATLEKLVKDKVGMEESEIKNVSDGQVQERSLEAFSGQTALEVDEVEEIEKISESHYQDSERIANVETLDVQTPSTREIGLLKVDENSKNGTNDTALKGANIEDYVAGLEVVHDIESPFTIVESKNDEKANPENFVKDNVEQEESDTNAQVPERSLDVDPKDNTAIKVENTEDYVAELEVVPTIESQLELEESKNATVEKLYKEQDHLKEGEIALESDDQDQERSLEASRQSAQGVDEVEEIEKISEPQCAEVERDGNVGTLNIHNHIAHEIGLFHVDGDPKDGEDVKVVPSIESPLALSEIKKAEKENTEKFVNYNVEQKENEIHSESDDQVPENPQDVSVDEVKEIKKISEPQYQNFERVGDAQTPISHETEVLHVEPQDGDDSTVNKDVDTEDYGEDLKVVPTIVSTLAQEEKKSANLEKHSEDEADRKESEIAPGFDVQVQGRSLEALPRQSAQEVDKVEENEKISELQCQDFERVVDAETVDVQIPSSYETVLLQIDEDPKDGDNDTTNKGVNSTTLEDVETNEDASIINVGTSPQYETGLQGNVVSQEEENETATITEKIGIQDGEKEGTVREAVEEETNKNMEKKFDVERVIMSEDASNINIGSSPQYESGHQENEVSQAEKNEATTIIEKIEIQDGVKEAFQEICEEGTVKEGGDGKTSEDVEKKVERQFQVVERVEISEVDSIINVGTYTQYETELHGKVVSQEEVPKTTTTLEKIEIQDGENEGTVREGVDDETSKGLKKKFETQFQDVEKMTMSEDASIINIGTSPHHETGLQEDEVSQAEKNETTTIIEKIEIQDGVKEAFQGTVTEGGDGKTSKDVEKKVESQFQDVERVETSEDDSIINVGTSTKYETEQGKVVSQEEEPETTTLEKIEIHDGEKEGTIRGVVEETSKDMEKKFETRFQYVKRVTMSEEASIINIGTSPHYETGLQGDEVSQAEKNETTTIIEKIEIQDGVKEAFQGTVTEGTEGGDGKTSEDVEKKVESQFQDVERVETIEDDSIINVGTSTQYETELQGKVASQEEEPETTTTLKKIEIQDGEKEGTIRGVVEETSKDMEKKFEAQFQDVERVTMSEDASIIHIGTSPHYETGLRVNEVSQAEKNETTTIIEKLEIEDGVKEAFQGTVTEGGDGKTSEDVEKKVESQFQDVERVETSEDDSIINVGTSTQYEIELQEKVVSQKEEPETTTLEKIEIHDSEKEGTIREGVIEETSKDLENKFETQFQDVERVAMSEDASIINIGTSPHYETGLQGNVVSQAEKNETATIIEKLEIQDGVKEAFQGTVTEGGDGKTSEDVEKKVESQFQDVERVKTSEDDSIINVGTSTQYETELQGKVVSQEEEHETTTTLKKIEIQDGEKEGTLREGVVEETSKDLGKKFETQFQEVERVTMSEDASIINIGTSPHYETGLQGNVVSQAEKNETATIIEKLEIQDGVKEAFQGTVTEGGDEKTSEDMEKKVESQFQDVETSENDSIINVGTSTQYETELQGKVVSQEEEPETTTLEKIEIQDGEKEIFQGICEKGTVTEDGYEETSKDEEKKFETQFQDVERVGTSENASIIDIGTSPQYETGLQVNMVSQEKENETEKVEIQNGEKEIFPGICEQSTVMEGGDGETSEDMEFQDVKRVATCEDVTIIKVGISQNERGLQGNVTSEEEKNETTITDKIEIQEGEKEAFQGICEKGTVTEDGNGETSEDVEKKFETQFQDVERVATSEYVSTINVGTSPEHETGLGMNVVSPKEENETATITKKIEIRVGEKESCEWSKDVNTNQDTKEPISVEAKSVNITYYEELDNPMEEIERDKDVKSTSVKVDLQTEDAETEFSIKPIEGLSKETFEQSKDVCTNHDSKELVTTEDKVVTETYHKERELVNPMEENDGDKDVKSALVTEVLQTGDDYTVVRIKPREVLTKESFEQSKDVCTNQDTKELVNVEDKVVTETYHEERALVNPMEENKKDKDVKSASVTLDLQTGDNNTGVIIKPTEVLTKEEPVELSTMGNEGKLKETNTDSNMPIDNDEENKDQIKKSIDSPHAKHSSPELLNEERNVDEEYEEVTERFTVLKPTKLSLSDLMQKSIREAPQVADGSIQKKELIDDNREEKIEGIEIKHGEESKTDEENDEGDEHKGQDSGSDAPVMVEASRDIDIKHTPKKSHNILSGVGSKVKHSIAKVKKAITGKTSPHTKPPSPRIDK